MNRRDREKADWVRETQMFQRIAGVKETSKEELEKEWEKIKIRNKNDNEG